ncbi:MAG: CDP-alcohol phosphatidyltransferase family protein [Planctomycetes bacterium]|nr:CDP-alcohol phosphatidyltransferase family protein [Planctomycetota bacterium]
MSTKARYLLVQYVTVARVPLAAAAAVLLQPGIASPRSATATVVVALLVISELTDIFDGLLARRLNVSSRFGSLFDPYCDSASRLIIFFGLASAAICPLWLLLLLALRDVSVAYIRIMCVLGNKPVAARLSGKTKAWVQGLGAILLAAIFAWAEPEPGMMRLLNFDVPPIGWALKAIILMIAGVTLWSLLDYFAAARAAPGAQTESH